MMMLKHKFVNKCILFKCNNYSYSTVENKGLLSLLLQSKPSGFPINGVYPILSPDEDTVTRSPVSDKTYNYLIYRRTMNGNLLYLSIKNFQQPLFYIPTPFDHHTPSPNI